MPQTTNQTLQRDRDAWILRNQDNQTWAFIAQALGFTQESVARAASRRHARRLGIVPTVNPNRARAGRSAALQRFGQQPIPSVITNFLPINQRTFGVEIEFKTAPKHLAAQKVADALGVPHIHSFQYHSNRCETCQQTVPPNEIYSQWKVERDGSVTRNNGGVEYGGELVSPILSVDGNGLQQITTVTRALKSAGATVDRWCGLHIHISVKDLDNQQRANIVDLWSFQERVIERFVAKSRINNQYCARMSSSRVANTVQALRQGNSITTYNSKMQSLNVLPFETPKKTFEVRLHQGTLSGKKINAWVKLLLAFFQNSALNDRSQTDFPAPDPLNIQVRPMLGVLAGKGFIGQREANYLTERADALERRN
jgi:hypothetical protein